MPKTNPSTAPAIIGWRAVLAKGKQNIVADYLEADCPQTCEDDKTAWDSARDFLVDEAFTHLARKTSDADYFEDMLCDAEPAQPLFESIMGATVFIVPIFSWDNTDVFQVDGDSFTVNDRRGPVPFEMALVNTYEDEVLSSAVRAHDIARALNSIPPQL